MKTLYLECKMGAAGDMLMAALYELTDKKEIFLEQMNCMFEHKVTVAPQQMQTCGISGTYMKVQVLGHEEHHSHDLSHEKHHGHHSYHDLLARIDALPLPQKVRADAAAVYRLIGEAEAKVHNCTLEHIHFHEVGSYDALADVVGCCLLFSYIHADRILSSPVHVGNGTVHCAHGILPVPAPATTEILRGIPYYTGDIQTELCTPTGAALLKYFVDEFSDMPVMNISNCGIGLGTKKLAAANMIRIFSGKPAGGQEDTILDISCNMDDMTGEALGYAMNQLLDAGALDVYYIPVQMKKNRPGILLHCLCEASDKEKFTKLVFAHTTTRGVRYQNFTRAKLTSSFSETVTPYGIVRTKISEGYGVCHEKYEYEDVQRIACEQGMTLAEVHKML